MIIPPTWTLPEAIRIRLGQTTYGRQRAIVEDGHVLLVLHKPPGTDERAREGLLFWRNPKGDWLFSRDGGGTDAIKKHVQSFLDIEDELSHEYDKADDTHALF